jgi:predicted metal-binding transcription factor (methanogenesis marker protein 9)
LTVIDPEKLRDIPGWKDAPIHICMDADYRGLTFCCKPGHSLTFAFKCKRDENLEQLGISQEDFITIKEKFSKENSWDSKLTCFGSLSYCCMRKNGCPKRDAALQKRYAGKSRGDYMKIYYQKKKELSKIILVAVKNPEAKKHVKFLLNRYY